MAVKIRKSRYNDREEEDLDEEEHDEDEREDTFQSGQNDDHIPLKVFRKSKGVNLAAGKRYANLYITIYAEDNVLLTATLNRDGDVNIKKTSPMYTRLQKILNKNGEIYGSLK